MARASLLTLLSGLCKRPLPPRPLFYLLTAAILGFTLLVSLFTPNLRSAHIHIHIDMYIYIYIYIWLRGTSSFYSSSDEQYVPLFI